MKKHITRLGVRTASAVAAMVFVANAAWALEPFKVQDIRVEGLQRVEPGTIFASMPLRVGDDYNDDKGAAAIRALFALGLFKDVRLEANGNVLVPELEQWLWFCENICLRRLSNCRRWRFPRTSHL